MDGERVSQEIKLQVLKTMRAPDRLKRHIKGANETTPEEKEQVHIVQDMFTMENFTASPSS